MAQARALARSAGELRHTKSLRNLYLAAGWRKAGLTVRICDLDED
jgi:hypothetical protein